MMIGGTRMHFCQKKVFTKVSLQNSEEANASNISC